MMEGLGLFDMVERVMFDSQNPAIEGLARSFLDLRLRMGAF
jgi:hypothetical protein